MTTSRGLIAWLAAALPAMAGAQTPAPFASPLELSAAQADPAAAKPEPASGGAWLGVQLAPMPAALASHLKLDDIGVMVRNIFKSSPADQAGLQRYDVFISVDGKPVNEGVETFSKLVHDRKPGDKIDLGFYRGGARQTASVTLGAAPPRAEDAQLKYEDDPDIASRRTFGLRGKILRPGPDGWILDDLGELPELPEFKTWMQRGAPSSETGPGEIESRQVDADGNVLQVRREKDGTIEVYRQKHGTNKRETTRYTDIDALRKQDAAAAKLLDEVISADAPDRVGGNAERSTRERRSQDNRRSLQDALRDYMQKYEHQWERRIAPPDSRQWQEWHHRFFVNPPPNAPAPPDNALRGRKRSEADAPPATPPAPVPPGGGETPAERTSFEVRPDGSITAQVDSGGTQLTMSFPDEHAFEQKAPRLYERFKASMELTR